MEAGSIWGAKVETLTGEGVGLAEKLRACVQVGEGSDAQTVGGVKLSLQELAADLTDVHQLEEAGCWQQNLRPRHTKRVTTLPQPPGWRTDRLADAVRLSGGAGGGVQQSWEIFSVCTELTQNGPSPSVSWPIMGCLCASCQHWHSSSFTTLLFPATGRSTFNGLTQTSCVDPLTV